MVLQHIFDIFLPLTMDDEEGEISLYSMLSEIKLHNIIRIGFEIIRGFSLVILKKEEKLYLHVFRKRFNKNYGNNDDNFYTNEGEYVSTVILDEKVKTPRKYDWLKIEPENEIVFNDGSFELSGKKPMVGNNVSHSNKKTKRRFNINLIKKKFFIPSSGEWITLKVTTSTLKTIDKKGVSEVIKIAKRKGLM